MSNKEIQDKDEYIRHLEEELRREKQKREEDKQFYTALEEEYEMEVKDLKHDLNAIKGKMLSQQIILESYKAKVGIPLIVEGKEIDLYDGEQRDFIISLIDIAYKNSDKLSRTHTICESLLKANPEFGKRRRMKEELSTLFKKYDGADPKLIKRLQEIGVSAEFYKNNHIKISIGDDDRYIVSVSATPSDYRCGTNALADINRVFF